MEPIVLKRAVTTHLHNPDWREGDPPSERYEPIAKLVEITIYPDRIFDCVGFKAAKSFAGLATAIDGGIKARVIKSA
jgi:hypothetical protein